MANASNIYGDFSIPGRASNIMLLGDSVALVAARSLPAYLPNVRGLDEFFSVSQLDQMSGNVLVDSDYAGITSPTNDIFDFTPQRSQGAGTLSASVAVGATTCTVNAIPGNSQPSRLMYVTFEAGTARAETLILAASYSIGNTAMTFRTAFAFAHASGTAVAWARPSGVDAYSTRPASEMRLIPGTYAGGALTTHPIAKVAWGGYEMRNIFLNDFRYWQSRGREIPDGPVRLSLFYLALPQNPNGNFFRLAGQPTLDGSANEIAVGPLFNLWAATPTIRKVSMDVPAATAAHFSRAYGPILYAYLEGACTITAGAVMVRLNSTVEAITAVGGTLLPGQTLFVNAISAYALQDFNSHGQSGSGNRPCITPNFAQQFVAAAGIDTLLVELGSNNGDLTTQAQFLTELRDIQNTHSAYRVKINVVNLALYDMGNNTGATLTSTCAVNSGSANFSSVTGLVGGMRVTFEDGTGNWEEAYVKSSYTPGNLTVPFSLTIYGTQKNHASGSGVNWMNIDPATSFKARITPLLSAAMIAQAADPNVFTFDMYAAAGPIANSLERFFGNQSITGHDWLHPQGQAAQEWMWSMLSAAFNAASTAASGFPSVAQIAAAVATNTVNANVTTWGGTAVAGLPNSGTTTAGAFTGPALSLVNSAATAWTNTVNANITQVGGQAAPNNAAGYLVVQTGIFSGIASSSINSLQSAVNGLPSDATIATNTVKLNGLLTPSGTALSAAAVSNVASVVLNAPASNFATLGSIGQKIGASGSSVAETMIERVS